MDLDVTWPTFWTGLSSIAAAASAAFAAWQLRRTRLQVNRTAAFEHFRVVDARIRELWQTDIEAAQRHLIDVFNGKSNLEDADIRYLVFLNALDLLAFAREEGVADRRLVDKYIPTMLRPHMVTAKFLREFQACCGDHEVYEHLTALLLQRSEVMMGKERRPDPPPPPPKPPAPAPGPGRREERGGGNGGGMGDNTIKGFPPVPRPQKDSGQKG